MSGEPCGVPSVLKQGFTDSWTLQYHVTIYSKLDEIGTLSKYINKLKDEMRDEKRNREEADTDYQNAVRKLEKGSLDLQSGSVKK